MQLTYVAVVVLACMVFVLSGMIGYLYWQQTKILQQIQSLAIVISSHLTPRIVVHSEPEAEGDAGVEAELDVKTEPDVKVEDDRLTVDDTPVEHVSGPPSVKKTDVDIDDLDSKTAAQLRDILTQRGIPFGKRDAKTVLVQLLKAAG